MSESHELYKKYLADKRKTENARKSELKYIENYEKDEEISCGEWKEKEREEKDDNDRTDRLFGHIY